MFSCKAASVEKAIVSLFSSSWFRSALRFWNRDTMFAMHRDFTAMVERWFVLLWLVQIFGFVGFDVRKKGTALNVLLWF